MRREILLITAFVLVALSASAQVEKSVEVTKDFIPEIAQSERLSVVPEIRDTVKMRPEIDYSITPKAIETTFAQNRFSPSTLTYWDMETVSPFYLRMGVGYPVNTVGDFYASTFRKDVGYAMGYFNHVGKFSDIRMKDEQSSTYENNSSQMMFRVGAAGGKFYGKNILEGDINYESDIFHRYPYPEYSTPTLDAREVNYELLRGKFRFGSSDLSSSRLGYSVDADLDYLNDKSQTVVEGGKYRQMSIDLSGVVDFRLGEKGRMNVGLGWSGYYGLQSLGAYSNGITSIPISYSYSFSFPLQMRVGLKAYVDCMKGSASFRVVPDVRLDWNIWKNGVLVPYLTLDGKLKNNSYRRLLDANQYLSVPSATPSVGGVALDAVDCLPNTVTYGLHVGVAGHTRSGVLAYDVSFNMDYSDHDLYWYNMDHLYFAATTAHRTTYTVDGMVEYHPLSELILSLEAEGMFYSANAEVENALPSFRTTFDCTYRVSRFSVSLGASYVSGSKWTVFSGDECTVENQPGAFLLELGADYRVRRNVTLFLEGHNLANQNIYTFLNYKEYGIGFTVGVRWAF